MGWMRPRRFRFWLVLAVAAGLASCEINPQPPLPGSGEDSSPSLPGANSGGASQNSQSGAATGPAAAGSLNLSTGGTGASGTPPVIGAGGAFDSMGGAPALTPGNGGASGEDAGGAAGDEAGGALGVGSAPPK
jgi:hypothetical protein